MSDPYYNIGTPHPGDDNWPRRRPYQLNLEAQALLKMLDIRWSSVDATCSMRIFISKPYRWSAWTDPVPSYEDVARLVAKWDAETCPTIAPR